MQSLHKDLSASSVPEIGDHVRAGSKGFGLCSPGEGY